MDKEVVRAAERKLANTLSTNYQEAIAVSLRIFYIVTWNHVENLAERTLPVLLCSDLLQNHGTLM